MLLGTKNQLKKANFEGIIVNGERIKPVTKCKNLGVIFDAKLSMEDQISAVCSACYFQLRQIRCIKDFLTRDALAAAIHSLVISRLDNCNSLLIGLPQSQLNRLQKVQNSAARMLTGTQRRSHITPVLKGLHWLPVAQRIIFKSLVLIYKTLRNMQSPYLSRFLPIYNPLVPLRSQGNGPLIEMIRTSLKTCGDRTLYHSAVTKWNSLPHHIRNATSLAIFKKLLKTFLFQNHFN